MNSSGTKIILYQSAHDPQHTSSLLKHGRNSVIAWACMAAVGTHSLTFTDAVSHDGGNRMNSEVYRKILAAE